MGCLRRCEGSSCPTGQLAIARLKLGKAGQPPASKVLIRHGPPASMGAWSSARQVDRQHDTRQIKENKEDADSSTDKLECQDHVCVYIYTPTL